MNFKFYIFGTPRGLELYQGSGVEINYFQTFDNESKENTKLVIHRMASQVSYSYLQYNLISSSGRTGSFFGMSVVFNKMYCADIESLYNLFEAVYKTILQNKILLEESKNAQAKYLVRSFAEAETEVKRIENIICKNIEKQFADDIRPFDSSFKQGDANSTKKLSISEENSTFLSALCEYSWITISPENVVPALSPEAITNLDETIDNIQKKFAAFSIDIVMGYDVQKDIERTWKQIKSCVDTIQPCLKIQPELQKRNKKLLDIQKQLYDLNNAVSEKNKKTDSQKPPEEEPITTGRRNDDYAEKEEAKIPTISEWKRILNKNKWQLIAMTGVIIFVIAFQYYSNNAGKPRVGEIIPLPDPTEQLIAQGNAALNNNDFDTAIEKFTKAKRTDLVIDAKTKAVEYWQGKAADIVKVTDTEKTNAKKIEKLKLAISYLEKTKDYGGYSNLKKDMAEFQKEIERLNAPPAVIPATPVKLNETNLSIEVRKGGKVITDYNVKVGELFSIKVTGNNGGQWKSSDTNKLKIQDKIKDITTIKFWEEGRATLSFVDSNGNTKSITFTAKSDIWQ